MNYEIKIQSQDLKPTSDFRNGTNYQEVGVQRQPILRQAPNLEKPYFGEKEKKRKEGRRKGA